MTTYGICYGEGTETRIVECDDLASAKSLARHTADESGCDVDVVELEGSGPVYASDGTQVAPTHAPKRTLETVAR